MGAGSHTRTYTYGNGNEKLTIAYDSGGVRIFEPVYLVMYNRANKVIEDSGKYVEYDYSGDYSRVYRILHIDPRITLGGNVLNSELLDYNPNSQLIKKKLSYLADRISNPHHVYYKQFEYTYDTYGRVSMRRDYKITNDVPSLEKTNEYTYFEPAKRVEVNLGTVMDELSLKNDYNTSDLSYISSVKQTHVNGTVTNYQYKYEFNADNYPTKIIKMENGTLVYTITINYNCQ